MALKVFAVSVVEFLDFEPTSPELRRLKVSLPSWEKTEHPLRGQRWHKPARAAPRCVMKAPKGAAPSYMLSSSSLLDSVSCCLCPTDARGGSDFMGFLPTGRVAWATAQDERQYVCLQPLGGGGRKRMPLRHKHKEWGSRISYSKDCSTFMGIKGLWRKQCVCLIWMISFLKQCFADIYGKWVPFHCSQMSLSKQTCTGKSHW